MVLSLNEKGLNIKINNFDIVIGSEEIRSTEGNQTIIFRKTHNLPAMSLDNGKTYSIMLSSTWEDIHKLVSKYISTDLI